MIRLLDKHFVTIACWLIYVLGFAMGMWLRDDVIIVARRVLNY